MSSAPAFATKRNQDLSSAVREAEERYVAANPESQRLALLAAQRLPGGNTRTTVHFSPFPLYMASGKGSRLTDVDAHVYADFINEYTAGVFGHSNPIDRRGCNWQALKGGINLGAPTQHEFGCWRRRSAAPLSRHAAAPLLQLRHRGQSAGAGHRAGHHRQADAVLHLRRRLSRQHPVLRPWRLAPEHEIRLGAPPATTICLEAR